MLYETLIRAPNAVAVRKGKLPRYMGQSVVSRCKLPPVYGGRDSIISVILNGSGRLWKSY